MLPFFHFLDSLSTWVFLSVGMKEGNNFIIYLWETFGYFKGELLSYLYFFLALIFYLSVYRFYYKKFNNLVWVLNLVFILINVILIDTIIHNVYYTMKFLL